MSKTKSHNAQGTWNKHHRHTPNKHDHGVIQPLSVSGLGDALHSSLGDAPS